MRFASKAELLKDIDGEHARLAELIDTIPRTRWREPGVWGDGWTVHDLVAHLHEWHALFLRWYADGEAGRTPVMPAPGYKWNGLPALNRAIRRKHHRRATAAVMRDFETSHRTVHDLAASLPPAALLKPGRYVWTGKYPLATYLGPNTGSHYRFAIKVLTRWLRRQPTAPAVPARSRGRFPAAGPSR